MCRASIDSKNMLLTEQNICYYLLDKGLLTPRQIVNGEFRVDIADSRNRNFIVNRDYDNAYFIKHIRTLDVEHVNTLQTEATCYWLANNEAQYSSLKDFMPTYHSFDYNNNILIIGFERGKITLNDYYDRTRKMPIAVAQRIGSILNAYHGHVSELLTNSSSARFFKKGRPWVFSIASNQNRLPSPQTPEGQIFTLINSNPKYKELIAVHENTWENKSLVHSDIKFTNFLIDHSNDDTPNIKLVDWELADIGDPCWDVASVLQAYLNLWLIQEMNKDQQYGFSLPLVQESIAAFWKAYSEDQVTDTNRILNKALAFCALKMIHTCLETTPGSPSLGLYGAKLLQLSFNILDNPDGARSSLLGIS
jgi:Phosphotransferase enzyme family